MVILTMIRGGNTQAENKAFVIKTIWKLLVEKISVLWSLFTMAELGGILSLTLCPRN